jgi:hypothetical protein
LGVKIFPISDTILLPLRPAIARTIADYLRLITQEVYVHSSQDCDNVVTRLPQDLARHWQFEKSIGLVPTSQYQYVSTIAHQLAAKSGLTPQVICQQLQLPSFTLTVDRHDRLELCCWYNAAGYIYFQLTPRAISIWLDYIHDLPLDRQVNLAVTRSGSSTNIAIYAHARCCSLLKLAQRDRLVTMTDNWQIVTPDRIYLENHLTAELTSIFEQPAEHQLIHALMEVLDRIYSDNLQSDSHQKIRSPNWTKLTITLAQSWLEFQQHCRIFGDTKSQNPRLAIARCGLTAISRRYLQILLEDYLGIHAAIKL